MPQYPLILYCFANYAEWNLFLFMIQYLFEMLIYSKICSVSHHHSKYSIEIGVGFSLYFSLKPFPIKAEDCHLWLIRMIFIEVRIKHLWAHRWHMTVIFPQDQFNATVGTYNSFQHPMGGGQPPQLPTSPPTYESVSDCTPPTMPSSRPYRWTDKQERGTNSQGRAVILVCLQFFLCFT